MGYFFPTLLTVFDMHYKTAFIPCAFHRHEGSFILQVVLSFISSLCIILNNDFNNINFHVYTNIVSFAMFVCSSFSLSGYSADVFLS